MLKQVEQHQLKHKNMENFEMENFEDEMAKPQVLPEVKVKKEKPVGKTKAKPKK